MPRTILLPVFLCTALAACMPSEAQQALTPTARKEKDPMEPYRQKLNPDVKITPEQLLLKTLKLMQETKSVDELTPERLEEIYGVPVKWESNTRYGFIEKISQDWWHHIEMIDPLGEAHLSIDSTSASNTSASSFPECNITFEDFLARAEKLGFTVKHWTTHEGFYEYSILNNGNLAIQISPLYRATGDEPQEGEPYCVGLINIAS